MSKEEKTPEWGLDLQKQIDTLARGMQREFRDLHHAVNYLSEKIQRRFEVLEGKVDSVIRRMDNEVEERAQLADRLSKVEEKVL